MVEIIKFDGFDRAVIGIASVWKGHVLVDLFVYDGNKILDILMLEQNMSPEDAADYMNYNIVPLYAGEGTPIVMWPQSPEEAFKYAAELYAD